MVKRIGLHVCSCIRIRDVDVDRRSKKNDKCIRDVVLQANAQDQLEKIYVK